MFDMILFPQLVFARKNQAAPYTNRNLVLP